MEVGGDPPTHPPRGQEVRGSEEAPPHPFKVPYLPGFFFGCTEFFFVDWLSKS